MENKPKYLVRPVDYTIFVLNEETNLYYCDGSPPTMAFEHFNYENLTENFDYFQIQETEIPKYQDLQRKYFDELLKNN